MNNPLSNQVELSRDYWLQQTGSTIDSEMRHTRAMRDLYREQLNLAIDSGKEEDAAKFAIRVTRQTRIIAVISGVIHSVTA